MEKDSKETVWVRDELYEVNTSSVPPLSRVSANDKGVITRGYGYNGTLYEFITRLCLNKRINNSQSQRVWVKDSATICAYVDVNELKNTTMDERGYVVRGLGADECLYELINKKELSYRLEKLVWIRNRTEEIIGLNPSDLCKLERDHCGNIIRGHHEETGELYEKRTWNILSQRIEQEQVFPGDEKGK